MTALLRKLFIKDYQNTSDPEVRKKHGFLSSFVGIFVNLVIAAFKLAIGIITMSMSVVADALNNFSDMAGSIVNLIGFKLANKPADKKHPFGHERIEYIAGLIISFVIVAFAVILGYSSVKKIISGELAHPNVFTFVILGVSILLKLWLFFFYRKIGKAIDSLSLKANSRDSLNDAIATSAVLIAAIIEFASGGKINIDGYLGIAVSLFIVVSGIRMVIETANPLIGLTPDHDLVKAIITDILSYEGVLGVHDCMCHSYGPTKIFMTIHVEVDSRVNVTSSHDLIDNIENEVGKKHNVLLTIHMDPIETQSEEIKQLKEITAKALQNLDENISFHDFRIVKGDTHTNVIFDVVLPFDSKESEEKVLSLLKEQFEEINQNYKLVISFDRNFID